MPKVICLTPTGDRVDYLNRSRHYFERSKVDIDKEWVVIDDGKHPYDPGGCKYYRREPDGPKSLARNVIYGLQRCDSDYVIFWEDDDYYHPDRIQIQVDALRRGHDLHGWKNTIYYHLKRGWRICANIQHASLFETAGKTNVLQEWSRRLPGHSVYIDVLLWKAYTGPLDEQHHYAIGIKGGPGRMGLGFGHHRHTAYTRDPGFRKLTELVGPEDSMFYQNLIKQHNL